MIMPDKLLSLLTQLQSNVAGESGRHLLLEYMCKSSEAWLGVIYILNTVTQTLDLVEHYGQPPQAGEIANDIFASHLFHVPTSGVFGSVLPEHGLVLIPDLCADPRSLLEERRWVWPAGQALLSALSSHAGQQGVLLLCFRPGYEVRLDEQYKANLMLCVALLSAYLAEADVSDSEAQSSKKSHTAKR